MEFNNNNFKKKETISFHHTKIKINNFPKKKSSKHLFQLLYLNYLKTNKPTNYETFILLGLRRLGAIITVWID